MPTFVEIYLKITNLLLIYTDRMLAAPWRHLFLAAFWAIPGTWLRYD